MLFIAILFISLFSIIYIFYNFSNKNFLNIMGVMKQSIRERGLNQVPNLISLLFRLHLLQRIYIFHRYPYIAYYFYQIELIDF